jgi:signal transduction histidine kinase
MEFLSKEDQSRLSRLKMVHNSERDKSASFEQLSNLQKVVVRQNLHQMVSPLNAIQGYLELLDASADVEPNAKQRYYKKQIETGLNELHNILNHIHSLYEGQLPKPKEGQLPNTISDIQKRPSKHLLDVDVNWVIRDGIKKVNNSETFMRCNLANTHTHIEADVLLLRVVFHELFSLCSRLYTLRGITTNVSTYDEEGRIIVCCELSEPIGLEDWSVDASLPLNQYHCWLDLAKSIGIQAESTNNQFTMSFTAIYGKQRVK